MAAILDKLIKIKPDIDLGYEQKCPDCSNFLIVNDFYIFGWRNLALGRCDSCQKEYVFDMAVGHGIVHPAFIEISENKLYGKQGADWFNKPLLDNWINKNHEEISINCVKNNKTKNKAIIINCLDIIYGHSLVKLLSLTYYLNNNYQNNYDIIVLIPKALLYLIPQEVDTIIVADIPFSKTKNFYIKIDEYLKSFFSKYDQVFLSPTPAHLYAQNYDLGLVKLNEPDYALSIKKICFSYRKDKSWGLTSGSQQRRIEKLFKIINKNYPDLKFFLIGEKDKRKFKEFIQDKRSYQITESVEKEWKNILSNSLTIGVHGSNMLIPSALAKYIIEMVPESRVGNAIQASLISNQLDGFQVLHKFRYIYGNEDLTNIDNVVKKMTLTLLAEDYDNIALYHQNKGTDWGKIKQAYFSLKYRREHSLIAKIKRKFILIIKR